MGLFSFAKGIMEKNKQFQFSSWKYQLRISWQTPQMEGWATGIRKDFRGLMTGTLRGGGNGVRPTQLSMPWEYPERVHTTLEAASWCHRAAELTVTGTGRRLVWGLGKDFLP